MKSQGFWTKLKKTEQQVAWRNCFGHCWCGVVERALSCVCVCVCVCVTERKSFVIGVLVASSSLVVAPDRYVFPWSHYSPCPQTDKAIRQACGNVNWRPTIKIIPPFPLFRTWVTRYCWYWHWINPATLRNLYRRGGHESSVQRVTVYPRRPSQDGLIMHGVC